MSLLLLMPLLWPSYGERFSSSSTSFKVAGAEVEVLGLPMDCTDCRMDGLPASIVSWPASKERLFVMASTSSTSNYLSGL